MKSKRPPNRLNLSRATLRYIIINLKSQRQRILKAASERKEVTNERTLIRLLRDFQQKYFKPEEEGVTY